MDVDPATFLAEVYAITTDFCAAHPAPPRPGPPVRMPEAAVLTLLVLCHYTGKSERAILRWAAYHRDGFPVLLSQSAFHRRAQRLAPRLALLLTDLAVALGAAEDAYEIVDGVPVPLAQRCRGERYRCFTPEEAGVGRGGAGKRWYFGVSVVLAVSASGAVTGLAVAPANVGERWTLDVLLTWRHDPTAIPQPEVALADRGARTDRYVGPPGTLHSPLLAGVSVDHYYLADQGFRGERWQAYWRDELGATVVTAEQLAPALRHWFHHARQAIETVISHLTGALDIRFPGAKTLAGVLRRILTACVAFNLGMLINRRLGRDDFAIPTLCNL